jgi:undecaprenyl-diphosphatase
MNKNIFLLVNGLANKSVWFDSFAVFVAEYLPLIFVAVLAGFWFSNKANSRNNALFAGYASILGISINFLIALIYTHPRPFMDNLGRVLINHVPDTSFPSDHTTAYSAEREHRFW